MHELAAPGKFTGGLAWDGKRLWCADRRSKTISALDPARGRVLAKFTAPGGEAGGLDWHDGRLWHVDTGARRVYRIDPARGRVEFSAPLGDGAATGVAVSGRRVYVCYWDRPVVRVLDAKTGAMVGELAAPAQPLSGVCHSKRYLWFTSPRSDVAYAVDPERWDIAATLPLPVRGPTAVAIDGVCLWVADSAQDRLLKVAIEARTCYRRASVQRRRLLWTAAYTNASNATWKSFSVTTSLPYETVSQKPDMSRAVWASQEPELGADALGLPAATHRANDVAPGETVRVNWAIPVRFAGVRYTVLPDRVGVVADIPQDIRQKWTCMAPPIYSMADPVVRQAARDAVGDERNVYWMAVRVHDYVVDRLRFGKPKWHSVRRALDTGSGVCLDYSRAIVALCRLNGVPARTVRGVGHVTVEVWLPGYDIWFPINPTGDDPRNEPKCLYPRRRSLGWIGRIVQSVGPYPADLDDEDRRVQVEPEDARRWRSARIVVSAPAEGNLAPVSPGMRAAPTLAGGRLRVELHEPFDVEADHPIRYEVYLLDSAQAKPSARPVLIADATPIELAVPSPPTSGKLFVHVVPVDALGNRGPAVKHEGEANVPVRVIED